LQAFILEKEVETYKEDNSEVTTDSRYKIYGGSTGV